MINCNEAEKWIYDAMDENKFIFDSNELVYKYKNPKYPNKNYKFQYDPKSFMSRGTIINFGGSYRNERKMIFDGKQLQPLWTEVDDYGSVPPTFVCGDNDGEFDIGEFTDYICHNEINWLSKDKLKEITIKQINNKIVSSVVINNKKWNIDFELDEAFEFNPASVGGYKKLKFILTEDKIILESLTSGKKYVIESLKNETEELRAFLTETKNLFLIHSCQLGWCIYEEVNEYKLTNEQNEIIREPSAPLIWKYNYRENYWLDSLIKDEEQYKFFIKNNEGNLNQIKISEVILHSIKIELVKMNTQEKLDRIKNNINKQIEEYDDIYKRVPFNRTDNNLLEMYLC
jgi:hypothetical protein